MHSVFLLSSSFLYIASLYTWYQEFLHGIKANSVLDMCYHYSAVENFVMFLIYLLEATTTACKLTCRNSPPRAIASSTRSTSVRACQNLKPCCQQFSSSLHVNRTRHLHILLLFTSIAASRSSMTKQSRVRSFASILLIKS